jgi:SET domain-containing protein
MDASTGVLVKNSGPKGRGLFAARNFKIGEIISSWNPKNKYILKEEIQNVSEEEKRYVAVYKDSYLLIAEPERYMNHSCDPNTNIDENGVDRAVKDIQEGEEITGDYERVGTLIGFECKCGSKNCRQIIEGKKL